MSERRHTRTPELLTWVVALVAAIAVGCGAGENAEGSSGTAGSTGEFESDDPSYQADDDSGEGSADAGSGGAAGSAGESEDAAERAIEEADIIQLDGNRLFALSRYSGLSIIDVSVRDQLRMLGRWRTNAMPFEMILRGSTVISMFSSYPVWVWNEADGGYEREQTSRIVALDTSNPGDIQEIGTFDIPGEISDSRVVGDIFYVVSYENGYCYRCEQDRTTTILSLDVGNPGAIEQVDRMAFSEGSDSYSSTRRSISVTQDRMYVAGIEYNWDTNLGHSTIQAVDISDPAGTMVLGAEVEVDGQIESRWQMDEHEGILRVISQEGSTWGSGVMPSIETFTVASSQEITPLGHLEMQLPRPENLRSVRFDGERAFAVTFEQTDPLFTIDLSDPANPQQLGELEIPGWLYHMVPRGDRLMALGYEQGATEGGLTVSLFDVSDLTNPTMIDRVNFGGAWASMAEDQDRIHKAFNVLDDAGLILVPYSGWDYSGSYHCGSYHSGIQLVDFTTDTLTKRGVAPQHGNARRAFLHDERLFAVSDSTVSTFDIADRDAPVEKAQLALSHNSLKAKAVGSSLVRLEGDWWTEEAKLSVVPLNDLERDTPVGSLDLSALTQDDDCYWSYWGFVHGSQIFSIDSYAVLVWNNAYYYSYGAEGGKTGIAVVDVSEPSNPTLVAHKTFDFEFGGYGGWYGGYYGAVLTTGEAALQHGSTIVLQQRPQYTYGDDAETLKPYRLQVLDLSDPTDPVLASTVNLPDALGQTPLQLDGDVVLTSHWEPVPGKPGKVRFYVDRVDISAPHAPEVLPAINVPGSLLARDAASGRIATVDYQREVFSASSYSDCYDQYGYDAHWNWNSETCVVMHRTLKLVDVQGSQATLRDTLALQDGTYGQVALGQDRVFLVRYGWYNYNNPSSSQPTDSLMTLSGFGEGELRLSDPAQLSDAYFSWSTLIAHGTRVVAIGHYPGSVAVFDAAQAEEAPTLLHSEELVGNLYDVTLHGDTAICSLGSWGVQSVSLTD